MDTRVFVVRPKRFLSNLLLILTEFFKVKFIATLDQKNSKNYRSFQR